MNEEKRLDWEKDYIYTFGDNGILVYTREEFGYPTARPVKINDFIRDLLQKQRQAIRSEITAAMPEFVEIMGQKFALIYETKEALKQYRANLLQHFGAEGEQEKEV